METCRTCAKCDFKDEANWFDLFHTTRCEREIAEIRFDCSNWQLQICQNDGLPQKICSDCFSKFCNVYRFRHECQEAQVKLNNIFDKIETQSLDDDMEDTWNELETRLLQRQINQKLYCPVNEEDELLGVLGKHFPVAATIIAATMKEDKAAVSETASAKLTQAMAAAVTAGQGTETEAETAKGVETEMNSELATAAATYTAIEAETDVTGIGQQQQHHQLQVDDIIEEDFGEDDDEGASDEECATNGHVARVAELLLDEHEIAANASTMDGLADEDDGVLEAFDPVPTTLPTTTGLGAKPSTHTDNHYDNDNDIDYDNDNEIDIAFECKYCYKSKQTSAERFLTQKALLDHITAAHDRSTPFSCPACPVGFLDAASRTVHMKNEHVPKHFGCDVCGKKYADRFNLRHHIEKFHSETDFECGNCGKRFYSRKSLNYHMKWHQPELQLKCSQCERLFISQRHLKCHEETHAGVRNSESCTYCGKTFIHLKTLRWHLYRQHGGEKPYKCGNCTEAFASYVEKRIHMLQNHLENLTSVERTECMPCRQRFEHEDDLVEHIREEHLQRPKTAALVIANNKRVVRSKKQKHYSGIFQCDICTQRFNMKSALERHAAVHSSVGRPHMCPLASCAKRFKRAQDMNWHMKTHSNEKPNICDVCGKGFALKYVLNQHKRSHEVLEKNFQCATCGRAYLFEKSLRVHERVHTGKTYYKCDLCGEAFVTHMKFKSHIKKIHDPSSDSARKQLLAAL